MVDYKGYPQNVARSKASSSACYFWEESFMAQKHKSAPMKAWEVKLEILIDRPINRPTDGRIGKFHFQ